MVSLVLAAMGVTQCDTTGTEMYGAPAADYSVKGKVTDTEGNPIDKLEVTVSTVNENSADVLYDQNVWPVGSVSTKADGSFSLEQTTSYSASTLQIDVKDIDGEENGEFSDKTVIIKNVTFSGKDKNNSWYIGKADVSVPTIKLEKK